MKKFFRNNSLSIVFLAFFLVSWIAQIITGHRVYNSEMKEMGGDSVSVFQYLGTGHFVEATCENWESEFLQMALFVTLSMFLYQKGSSESKDPEGENDVDREPDPQKKNVPWPVKKGGFVLSLYKHSLGLSLYILFIISFLGHWNGSLRHYNQEQLLKHESQESAWQYLGNSRLWFESFENWQSEFLSVFAIVVLSIFLRDQHSPQSKPVDAPDSETGE